MNRTLYATGPRYNSLARMWTAPTLSIAENSLFPASNLWNRLVEEEFRASAAGTDFSMTFDLNLVGNPEFTEAQLTPWWQAIVTGTGAVTRDATGGRSGGPGMKVASGTGTATGYQDLWATPGERWGGITAWLKSDGTAALVAQLQNRRTKQWLQTNGTWGPSPANIMSVTANSFTLATVAPFVVESFEASRWEREVPLRLFFVMATGSVDAWVDDVAAWPATSGASFHGHDIEPGLAVQLRRDSAAFAGAGTLEATLTPYRLAFYHATAAGVVRDERWWRVVLAGTGFDPFYLGELVFTQWRELQTSPRVVGRVRRLKDQVRTQPAFGTARVRAVADQDRRVWTASFQDHGAAAARDFEENVMALSGFGEDPIVIVPDDEDPRLVIHGQLPPDYDEDRPSWGVREREIEIVEDPFPTLVA